MMIAHVYNKDGSQLLRTEEYEPTCGKHFCDRCGDCLRCFGDVSCLDSSNGEHLWVVYEGDDE